MTIPVTIDGKRVIKLRLQTPNRGPWVADADFDESPVLSTQVTLRVGELALRGAVLPNVDFVGSRKVRIVAGAGRWSQTVTPKAYHNDAGVKRRLVAEDVAREVGESIGGFLPTSERCGPAGAVDYVRPKTTASNVLEDLLRDDAGTVPWWVDAAGVTQAGPRAVVSAGHFELLAFDSRTNLLVLAVEDVSAIPIGATITDSRLASQLVVRQTELVVEAEELRVYAWCSTDESTDGRFARVIRGMVEHVIGARIWGVWRYRVTTMAGDGRVNLQILRRQSSLPDVLPATQMPGVAGAWSDLTPGSIVLVQFVEGDPSQPLIVGFESDKDGVKVPVRTVLDASTSVEVGHGGVTEVARKGDTVKCLMTPAVFSGTIGGAPASGVLTWPTMYVLGNIQTGSTKLKAE